MNRVVLMILFTLFFGVVFTNCDSKLVDLEAIEEIEENEVITVPGDTDTVNHFKVVMEDGVAKFYKNGEPFFIRGTVGRYEHSRAVSYGANAFRSYDSSTGGATTRRDLDTAKANGTYLMMGIRLSREINDYLSETYKNDERERISQLVDAYKDDPNLMIWGLGNEIDLYANTRETWEFINELAGIIKEKDANHPVATSISHSRPALDSIARYAPNIDVVGFQSYGAIHHIKETFALTHYKGAYIVSEWGPNGHWENGTTLWGAAIEPSSETKRIHYETRYTDFILNNDRCIGSFVFLWGQYQKRTPTWYSMFVESGDPNRSPGINYVPGLPLRGEATPGVESMEKVWTNAEPTERAPVVEGITMNGRLVNQTEVFQGGAVVRAVVSAFDPRGYRLTFHWEILMEATQFTPDDDKRPDRVGEIVTGSSTEQNIRVPVTPGNYRLFVYVLNGRGMVGTSNIPFQVGVATSNQPVEMPE